MSTTFVSENEIDMLANSAGKGDANACYTLWRYYREGQVVEKDMTLAVAFGMFCLAFLDKQEINADFKKALVDDFSNLSKDEIKKVKDWIEDAEFPVDRQILFDMFMVAYYVKQGMSPGSNSYVAVDRAHKNGALNPYLPPSFIEILKEGRKRIEKIRQDIDFKKAKEMSLDPDERDYEKIVEIYKKYKAEGSVDAAFELAKLRFFGIDNENGDNDVEMAKDFVKAVNEGILEATGFLSNCFAKGIGLQKDIKAATLYFIISEDVKVDNNLLNLVSEGKMRELFELIKNDETIPDNHRKNILSYMYFYGIGVAKSIDDAVMCYFEANSSEDKMVFSNKVPEMYGTKRNVFQYEICEEVLLAGIEAERNGSDNKTPEKKREVLLEYAKKYYIVALEECPRAAVYLLRYMLEYEDPDFLPFAAMISEYWVDKCSIDTMKAMNMANYLLGLYYEYYYSADWTVEKCSDFVLKSNLGIDKRWIQRYRVKNQDIDMAKECYEKATMIDDAARRYGMLLMAR